MRDFFESGIGAGKQRSDALFVFACVAAYAIVVIVVPPIAPLVDPDSPGYISFHPQRRALYPAFLYVLKALGLDLIRMTWVQFAVFAVALGYLLVTFMRAGFSKLSIALFVTALAANGLYSSFHHSIVSESLFFSMSLILFACWMDYFRTGKIKHLGWAGLVLGLMVGVRPVAISLIPLHGLSVWMTWRKRTVSVAMLVAVMILPVAFGIGSERLLYRAVHGETTESLTPYLLRECQIVCVRAIRG